MKLAIEAVGNRVGGGRAVLVRTVEALSRDERVERIDVFCSEPDRVDGRFPTLPRVTWCSTPDHLALRLGWYERGFEQACRRAGANVALCLNGMGRAKIPCVNVLQQALALRMPRGSVTLGHATRLRVIRSLLFSSCRAAKSVIVQTSWMGEAVRSQLGIRPTVLPLGLVPHHGGEPVGRPVVAAMGGRLPYKNAALMRRALRLVARRRGDIDFQVFDEPQRPYDEVRTVLQDARVTLVPSRIESFGLPLVESFAFDSAVLAADRPYAREVCDNAALYFHPDDPADAAARLGELLGDEGLRADLVRRGRDRLASLWTLDPYVRLVDILEEVS